MFLFTDTQIKEEAFLEDINNLLNAGEVPNIFAADEKQEIINKMRQLDKQRDKALQTDGTPLALFNMFIERVKDQLHIVLAMSPIGDALVERLRNGTFFCIYKCMNLFFCYLSYRICRTDVNSRQ